ncbi:MAG: hypothetical protein AMXMBFR61_21360 [Fimbriimonadales bacterium]
MLRLGKVEPTHPASVSTSIMRILLPLLLLPTALLSTHADDLEEFVAAADAAARSRDFLTLRRACAQGVGERFAFIVENGPYGGGEAGWRAGALMLPSVPQRYLVFHTPSRARDTTAYVFRVASEAGDLRIGARLPDEAVAGYRVTHHRFDIRLDPGTGKAFITDRLSLERMPGAQGVTILRMGSEFVVQEVRDDSGPLAFAQCGGVVAVQVGAATVITVRYESAEGLVTGDEAVLSGHVWWLSVGRLQATHSATVRVPDGWEVATMEPAVKRAPGVYEYQCKQPSTFLSLAAGRYRSAERFTGPVAVRLLHQGEMRGTPEGYLQAAVQSHQFFEWLRVPPWKRVTVLVSRGYRGKPLSVPGLIVMGPSTPIHEMPRLVAQLWLGGLAPATYIRNAWPEAFSDFAALLMTRKDYPVGTLYLAPQDTPTMFAEPVREGPLFLASPESGQSVWDFARRKGCKALEMLEAEIGRDALRKALRLFVTDAPVSRGVDWEDLQLAVDDVTGTSYRWFFDFWIGMSLWAEPKATFEAGQAVVSLPGMPGRGTVPVALLDARGGMVEQLAARITDRDVQLRMPPGASRVAVDPWWRMLRRVDAREVPPTVEQLARDTWVIVPDELWSSTESLLQRLALLWPDWQVRKAGDVAAADVDTHDVIFWGTGKQPLLWDLGVKFPLWDNSGRIVLFDRSYPVASHSGLAVLRNPRNPAQLVGRMFGVPENGPWTVQAGAIVWDSTGCPVMLHTDPILPRP